jgi:hypothetical protein
MPRYKLRTLLILLAIGPPILAGVWWTLCWLGVDGVVTLIAYSVGLLFAAVAALVRWKAAHQTVTRDESP